MSSQAQKVFTDTAISQEVLGASALSVVGYLDVYQGKSEAVGVPWHCHVQCQVPHWICRDDFPFGAFWTFGILHIQIIKLKCVSIHQGWNRQNQGFKDIQGLWEIYILVVPNDKMIKTLKDTITD